MEKNVLKDFQTFEEFPDSYLRVTSNSPYYFIRKPLEDFIARKSIDLVTNDGKNVIIEEKFYNVKNGRLILKRKITSGDEEKIESNEKATVILLSSILKLEGNKLYYFTEQEIDVFVNYKEESSKSYNLSPRKNYF